MRLTIARPAPIPARTRRPLPAAEQEAREDEDAEIEREANDILEARAPVDGPAERERTEHGQDSQGSRRDEERPVEKPLAARSEGDHDDRDPGCCCHEAKREAREATAVEGERHHDRRDGDRGTVLGEPGGDPC